jgi:putative oxidoreductase
MTTMTAADPIHLTPPVRTIAARLERVPMSVLLLLIRVGVGLVFFKAGLLKYNSWEFTVLLSREEYRVRLLAPEFAARWR